MNASDNQATPAAKETQHPSKDPVPTDNPKLVGKGFAFNTFSLVLSAAIMTTVGFVSYTGWQQLDSQKELIQNQQLQLTKILGAQNQISAEVQRQLQQNTLNQNNELTTVKETIAAFLSQNQHSRRDWLIAEAEYLIKLANHRLVLAHDVATGIQALQAADDRLLEVGNPKLIPLRKALAVDIQKLNAVPQLDLVGISLKLNALQQQIETLPLVTPDPKTVAQRSNADSSISKTDNWRQLPMAIWQDLLKLVHIQHHNETIKPLLLPEQHFFLVQNLKLQLEQARLALLSEQPVIYKDRIQQAQLWISLYFDKQQASTQTVNLALTKLAQTNISQTLPDISGSLTSLQLLHPDNTHLIKTVPVEKKSSAKTKTHAKPKKTVKPIATKKKIAEQPVVVQPAATSTTEITQPAIEKPKPLNNLSVETPTTKN